MTVDVPDITAAEYHADPAPEPSLSSSIANLLLDRSPLHAWSRHPRLGGQAFTATADMERGTLLHALLLGKGTEIVTVDADDWRTKRAREARNEASEQGKVPVLAPVLAEAEAKAAAIKRQLPALNGDSEMPILWQEDTAHGQIWCRAMIDHVIKSDRLVVYDLKTTVNAHPERSLRSALRYGYDVQAEAYTRALERLYPSYSGRIDFVFLFVEFEPPYAVLPAQLDGLMRERGVRRWREACETWAQCLSTDTWPGYPHEPVTLWSPAWLLNQESEAAAMRGEEFVHERE